MFPDSFQETYYVNHQRTGRSQLLGGVVHRLCELAAPLGGSLAPRVRSLLQPGRFDKVRNKTFIYNASSERDSSRPRSR